MAVNSRAVSAVLRDPALPFSDLPAFPKVTSQPFSEDWYWPQYATCFLEMHPTEGNTGPVDHFSYPTALF